MTEATGVWMGEVAVVSAALAEGKACEKQVVGSGVWKDIDPDDLAMFHRNTHYRIKPVPKYRPFTLEESDLLFGRRIQLLRREEPSQSVERIVVTANKRVEVILSDGSPRSFGGLLNSWVFADTGKPCGVLVEESR